VRTAGPHAREPPQTRGGEVRGIPLPALGRGRGVEQEVAVLGNEGEQQPVDQAQQGAVVVVPAEGATAEGVEQPTVRGVAEEAGAEGAEGALDPRLETPEGACPGVGGLAAPGLEPAAGGAMLLGADLEAGDVGELEEDEPLGVELAIEDGLEVELHVGRADEGGGVAQQPQSGAVGEDRPQVLVGAVEQLLRDGLRGAGGSGDAGVALVEVDAGAEQVDGHVLPDVGDGVVGAVDGQAMGRSGDLAVAELAQQRQQPSLAGRAGACRALDAPLVGVVPGAPRPA